MALPLGVVKEEVAVLVVLVRWYCFAVGIAVCRAVDGQVLGAVEEETGPAAVRRVPPGLLVFRCPDSYGSGQRWSEQIR